MCKNITPCVCTGAGAAALGTNNKYIAHVYVNKMSFAGLWEVFLNFVSFFSFKIQIPVELAHIKCCCKSISKLTDQNIFL